MAAAIASRDDYNASRLRELVGQAVGGCGSDAGACAPTPAVQRRTEQSHKPPYISSSPADLQE